MSENIPDSVMKSKTVSWPGDMGPDGDWIRIAQGADQSSSSRTTATPTSPLKIAIPIACETNLLGMALFPGSAKALNVFAASWHSSAQVNFIDCKNCRSRLRRTAQECVNDNSCIHWWIHECSCIYWWIHECIFEWCYKLMLFYSKTLAEFYISLVYQAVQDKCFRMLGRFDHGIWRR